MKIANEKQQIETPTPTPTPKVKIVKLAKELVRGMIRVRTAIRVGRRVEY